MIAIQTLSSFWLVFTCDSSTKFILPNFSYFVCKLLNFFCGLCLMRLTKIVEMIFNYSPFLSFTQSSIVEHFLSSILFHQILKKQGGVGEAWFGLGSFEVSFLHFHFLCLCSSCFGETRCPWSLVVSLSPYHAFS